MKLTDLTISAKLTIATTAVVLMVFVLVSGAILGGLYGLSTERDQVVQSLSAGSESEVASLLQQKTIHSIETAGALLADIAGRVKDPGSDAQLASLVALTEQDPEIAAVAIQDDQGASLIGTSDATGGSFREFPIERDGKQIGKVVVGLEQGFEPAAIAYLDERLSAALVSGADQREITMALVIALLILSALLIGAVIYLSIGQLSKRFILSPAERIRAALQGMEKRRDFSERLAPGADDELGRTVLAFNQGIDFLERQNDQLNDSIIEMLQVGADISQRRDLTLKMPMKEDITGPLRDALNQITSESARVLVQVRGIAERVGQASAQVQAQGARVVEVAATERELIEQAADELAEAVEAINGIAELARFCHESAGQASASTDQALASVKGAVEGMSRIRSTIQETGKRIKRLGERSQEISGIVDIINSFSERTHVLAINAAMQAATAGEAGRGFAVVAQEVQRLADSSRSATSQIETLIANIQVETQDSIQTVNEATEAVGTESRTIENAGELMLETQQGTAKLAEAVRQIDARAQAQVEANHTLMDRVASMRASTVETTDQLDHQTRETNQLVDDSKSLLEAIQLFRLPAPAKPEALGQA
ncbi:hypothetical protein G3480_03045 [Thiorhodococcus mannitoliphagus]|uniref:Methyl-accepting chemotaxis protein n=1 Tax=Thiorhodococcus mannitoliphagus TaxID=329406 RepID=A0A6P1DM16_9GAMM|nr:methyl-accepting chemotaxis protein [Thiorhodococcus mannitoliphagus]NEX19297.1 hypothetical protein [Thiorhodococcus mannitoliphagus]